MSSSPPMTATSPKDIQVSPNLQLYASSSLRDEAALQHAVSVFERQLQTSSEEVHAAISSFLEYPSVLEFLLSIVDRPVFDYIEDKLLEAFPHKAHNFSDALASKLLSRFCHYFWFLNYPLPELNEQHKTVQLAPAALQSLATTTFPDGICIHLEDDEIPVKKKSQRSRKKSFRNRAPTFDRTPFEKLGLFIPEYRDDADMVEAGLLQALRGILKLYLETLRDPNVAESIKVAYLGNPGVTISNDSSQPQVAENVVELISDEINEVPAAYPFIQPMKAAFHFDSVEGFGEWRILISTRADRNLRESKKKNPKLFAIILKKIRELSNGHFSDDNQKRLAGTDIDIPIFEAKMTGDTRLVYIVDCVKEYDSEVERQVLRIFGIYTHAQLDRRFWDAVSQHLAGKGKEYRKRCIFRRDPIHKGDKNVPPETFDPMEIPASVASPVIPDLRSEDREELHALLVLEKFVAFSQALLNSILADQDVVHVFQMSPPEQEIVRHAGSCYVLGRSGTGKTTTMLFKMLGIERTWETMREELGEGFSRPRQVFVTQSRVLAERVEEYYLKLTESHIAAGRTAAESAALAAAKNDRRAQGLVNRDEEEFYRGTLPKNFADLKDEHFPLFLTFDHLCRLLEVYLKDLDKSFVTSAAGDIEQRTGDATSSSDYMLQKRNSFVSYDVFLNSYWPHLPQSLTKGLDPALVFAEFMGVIKGSEPALASENGYLDRTAYINLSHRQQGTFASRRETVYMLFLAYMKLKRSRREWDAADRTHTLLQGLRELGGPGSKFDFIYIDEAQDNLLIDALVLRMLCRNPDGFFWAGDTAQTISAGSSFRFNDLKAFLYRLETAESGSAPEETPQSFQLSINYRSHGGIVRCAHSVVQLITKFWPHAIDVLAEEQGIVDGAKPVFFSGWDNNTVQYEQFLFGSIGNQIEFGAKQCILVRDDAARARLRDLVGDIGLVLTLYESKGLEFDDVLLYNFFEDSHVDISQWRVILNALPQQKGSRMKCPQFDETKHSGVCLELKLLYVGITRARKNVWIADCSERGEPLKTLWKASDLIDDCPSAESAPRLATVSTSEEWAETAQNLFDHGRYSQAMRCYERALMPRERDVANAYHLREQAKLLPAVRRGTVDPARVQAYTVAAQAFQKSAAASTNRNEVLAYNRIAGDCYAEIDDHVGAGTAYRAAGEYTRSAQHYRKAGSFDNAVDVVRSHGSAIPEADAESIMTVAKLYYFNRGSVKNAIDLFESFDDALEFMEDCGFDADRATLLENAGRLAEAAEYHIMEGRLVQGIKLLLRDASAQSKDRAENCLLRGLWQQLSFGLVIRPEAELSTSTLGDLLSISTRMVDQQMLSPKGHDEVTMFQAIVAKKAAILQALGHKFYHEYGDTIAALLCLDHGFRTNLKIQAASCTEIALVLQSFVIYSRELARIAHEQDPANDPGLQRLFGFSIVQDVENTVCIPRNTFLYQYSSQRNPRNTGQDTGEDIQLPSWELKSLIHDAIRDKLLQLVKDENEQCRKAPALSPCPTHAVVRTCTSNSCTAGHFDVQTLDTAWYIARVRVHFQQILIYQTLASLAPQEHKFTITREQRFWLSRLYHALHPVHQVLGSAALPGLFTFPEADRGLSVVKDWLRDAFYNFRPWDDSLYHFLAIVGELAALAFQLDKSTAQSYIERAPCVADTQQWPRKFMRQQGYIVHDLLIGLDDTYTSSISAGVIFLRTVYEQELSIDLDILCHLVDRVSSCLAISYRIHRYGSIHDTTLMREWILQLYNEDGSKDTHLLSLFVRVMADVISEVYTGKMGIYTVQNSQMFGRTSSVSNQQRHLYVARLFRSLVLLGYNIPTRIQKDIQRAITSLYKPGQAFPRILVKYIMASSWDDLVRALRVSVCSPQPGFDGLIQVKDRSKCNGPVRQLRSTRVVTYDKVDNIPSLLDSDDSQIIETQTTSNQYGAGIPTAAQAPYGVSSELQVADEVDVDDGEPSSPEIEEDGINQEVDLEAATRSAEAAQVYQPPPAPTEEENAAASVFARAYRLLVARRRGMPKKGLAGARARFFTECRQQAQDIAGPYRYLYLGPLPHALVCVESVVNYAIEAKKKARMRLTVVQHEEYERVSEELQRAMSTSKQAIALKKAFEPKAEIHLQEATRTSVLKARVTELETLIRGLPVAEGLQFDLGIAVKGIVAERPLERQKPKPTLAVEDDLDW